MNDYAYALKIGLKAGIRTLAQALAGSMGALAVAGIADFKNIPALAAVLGWSALIAALVAFFQNFAESLQVSATVERETGGAYIEEGK